MKYYCKGALKSIHIINELIPNKTLCGQGIADAMGRIKESLISENPQFDMKYLGCKKCLKNLKL